MFRAAGGIDLPQQGAGTGHARDWFSSGTAAAGFDAAVKRQRHAGVFTELVKTFGPDSLIARTAGTIFGSTETTFYVLAVVLRVGGNQADALCVAGGADGGPGGSGRVGGDLQARAGVKGNASGHRAARTGYGADTAATACLPDLRCEFHRPFAAVDEKEDGHADGEAIGYLVQNHRAVGIGDIAIDFHAAIDGTGDA